MFLQYAIQSWSFGRSYTLSQTSTTLTGKNFTVEGTCNGGESELEISSSLVSTLPIATMAGGTFWVSILGIAPGSATDVGHKTTTVSDPSIAAMSTG